MSKPNFNRLFPVLSVLVSVQCPALASAGEGDAAQAQRMVPVSELTPEEAARPASEWTLQQALAKGWVPYACYFEAKDLRAVEGRRWPQNDPDATRLGSCITYSYMPPGAALEPAEGANTWPGAMPAGSAGAFAAAAATWAGIADLHFTNVADGGGPWNGGGAASLAGNIRVGSSAFLPAGVLAHAYYPPPNGVSRAGDVHFNTTYAWSTAVVPPAGTFDVETVSLHELGHSLGLTHDCTRPADIMFPFYSGVNRTPNGVGAACAGASVPAACGGFCPGDVAYMTAIYGVGPHAPSQCQVACCFGPKVCGNRSQAQCIAQGGTPRPAGSQCPTQNVQTAQHASGTVVHWVDPALNCFNITMNAVRGRGQSTCCIEHPTPGCDSLSCQNAVCQMAPDCCFNAWLPHCVNFAQQFCGPLCQQPPQTCPDGAPIDAWSTSDDPLKRTFAQFGGGDSPPIPPDFFGPGSDPFVGAIGFVGEPLGSTPLGTFEAADTIICRPGGDPFDRCALPGGEIDIPIEIVALNLVSVEPIIVTYNGGQNPQFWNVRTGLSSVPSPQGSMTVRKTHCNGGTWESLLPVQAKFTFTNVQNPSDTRILDTGLAGQPPDMLTVSPTDDTPWVTDLDPNMTIEGGPTDFHPGIEDPNQPSACDCNLNGQRDSCDIEQGTSEDCQPNGVPDECDPDTDGDGIPDGCDNCPDHPNSIQADNNGDGVGDACAPQACCLSGGVCMDLPPPDCSTLGGAAQGTGTNCLTVVCPSICPPTPADPPHDRRKNRYLSFKPCSTNPAVKYKLTRVYPPPATDMGWVGAPDANGISAVLPDALKPPVRMWNEPVVHAGDCEIYPVPDTANTPLSCSLSGASCTQLCGTGQCPPGQGECMAPPTTYEIRATADNVNFSPPLTVTTVPRPCPKKWGDTVGDFAGGSWTAPNGVANVNDFLSTLQCFQVLPTRPHVSVCDVVGAGMMGFEACINKAGNIGDVFNLIKAFQGGAYPAYVCSISGHGCSNLGGACAAPGVGMCVIPDGTNCPACP